MRPWTLNPTDVTEDCPLLSRLNVIYQSASLERQLPEMQLSNTMNGSEQSKERKSSEKSKTEESPTTGRFVPTRELG